MSEKDLILNPSQNKINNLTISGYNFLNRINNSINLNDNNNNHNIININKSFNNLNPQENNILSSKFPSKLKPKNTCLFLKKLNSKETLNTYYTKAMSDIFFNPQNYFHNIYDNKKVIVGKNYPKPKGINDLYDYYYRQNKRKKKAINKSEIKSSLSTFQRTMQRTKSTKYQDSRRKSIDNNTSRTIILNSKKDFPLSDDELKKIYKDIIQREKNNKKKNIKYIKQNIYLNKSEEINLEQMLDLQEKILNIKNKRNKMNQKLLKKIMNVTFKEEDKILMNDNKEILIIKGKTHDKELIKFRNTCMNINDMMKKWIFNLRKNKKEEQKNKKYEPQEIIYYNKDISFNSEKNENNNIRKKLFQKINIKKNIDKSNSCRNVNGAGTMFNKIKSVNDENIKNKINIGSFRNLFIQGKNLLNQEIKLSKNLIGKKKKYIQYNFVPDEISSILVAKSNSFENALKPKAIINSMEVHKLQ